MMSLSSSQAGIVGARRKKLNQTQFSNYRNTRIEWDREKDFINGLPITKSSFIARSIYRYDKINNTFIEIGTQKGQSLIRRKTWINTITFAGSNPSVLDGTYIRSNLNSTVYWKNGVPNSDPNISLEDTNIWFFSSSQAPEGTAAIFEINGISFFITTINVNTLNTPTLSYETSVTIDNTSLNNINNNRLYTNTNPDLIREQVMPNANFDINTANIFDTKNLAHNQKVFIDARWTSLVEGRGGYNPITMNDRKGIIYRIGIIIKDNTVDSMLYHNDLATDPYLINQLQFKDSFYAIGVAGP